MVSHWSLSDNKSPQVSRTLLSILANLNYAVVKMISTRPLISIYSSPGINPLVTVARTPITIGIIVTFMFSQFFNPLTRSCTLFSISFNFILWTAKSTIQQVLFFFLFLLTIIRSGRLLEIRWSVCISKTQKSVCVSFSRTGSGLCI